MFRLNAVKSIMPNCSGVKVIEMLNEKELSGIAKKEFVQFFGMEYLTDKYNGSCISHGIIDDNTYQMFVGFEGSNDSSEGSDNYHGWIEYGIVKIDIFTGNIKEKIFVRKQST